MHKLRSVLMFTAVALALGAAVGTPVSAQEPPEGGRLVIELETNPRDRNQDFDFDVAHSLGASSVSDFTLEDDREQDSRKRLTGLDSGRYRFDPDVPNGWDFDGWDCDGDDESDVDDGGHVLVIDYIAGEVITCEATFIKDEEPTATPTNTPAPTATPQPPAPVPTQAPSVACIVGNSVVTVLGTACPALPTPPAPTAVPAPAAQVVQTVPSVIRPPSTGDGGLLD